MPALRPFVVLAAVLLAPAALLAETVVAARNLAAGTVIAPGDLRVADGATADAAGWVADAVGLELRQTVFAGRPVSMHLLGPPAVVERNQIVTLQFHSGGLAILTDGRALGRAAVGERLRVLNLSSRETVTGVVRVDGSVSVLTR